MTGDRATPVDRPPSDRHNQLTAEARPWVENLLHIYAQLCDGHDPSGLGKLLEHATLTFGERGPVLGADAITETYTALLGSAGPTRHLVSNLIVSPTGEAQVKSVAAYTRWTLAGHSPTLVGMGRYLSEFIHVDGCWRFAAHTVQRDWFLEG